MIGSALAGLVGVVRWLTLLATQPKPPANRATSSSRQREARRRAVRKRPSPVRTRKRTTGICPAVPVDSRAFIILWLILKCLFGKEKSAHCVTSVFDP